MQRVKRWLMLLGLPLLAALLVTLLDSAALRLAQEPLIEEQRERLNDLENRLASRDLTQMDEEYLAALHSEKLQQQHESEKWRNDHHMLIYMDRIQLLPSIAFWLVYFLLLARLNRKEPTA